MTATVLTNCQLYVGGFDFTGSANSISIKAEADSVEITTFNDDNWTKVTGGLKSVAISADTFWESNAPGLSNAVDYEIYTNSGASDIPATIASSSTVGSTVYIVRAGQFSHTMWGDVGNLATASIDLTGSDEIGLVRATLVKAKSNVSTTGIVGAAVDLGSLTTSDQILFGVFHVFSSGTSMTLKLTSSSDNTTYVDRYTFDDATTRGGYWSVPIPGPISDRYWRFYCTSITGTFNVAACIGAIGTTGSGAIVSPATKYVAVNKVDETNTANTIAVIQAGDFMRYNTTIGDNTTKVFTITHNFGTRSVIPRVYETASPYTEVDQVNITHATTNTITLECAVAPTTNQYTVVILA